jgi:hypothetical protein
MLTAYHGSPFRGRGAWHRSKKTATMRKYRLILDLWAGLLVFCEMAETVAALAL